MEVRGKRSKKRREVDKNMFLMEHYCCYDSSSMILMLTTNCYNDFCFWDEERGLRRGGRGM